MYADGRRQSVLPRPMNRDLGAFREVVHLAAMRTEDKFGNRFGAADDPLLRQRRGPAVELTETIAFLRRG